MPIYEYQCTNCEHAFETIQKVSEPVLTTCPSCGDETLRKKISAAGFRLKGGGWYETDFKSGGRKNVTGDDKATSDSKDGSSADAKSGGAGAGSESKSGAEKSSDTSTNSSKSTGSSDSKGSSSSSSGSE